jgi:hypothetical protein
MCDADKKVGAFLFAEMNEFYVESFLLLQCHRGDFSPTTSCRVSRPKANGIVFSKEGTMVSRREFLKTAASASTFAAAPVADAAMVMHKQE